ncbi:MAG: hypothetical protein KGI10_03045 [Thaumarchaeota archaeon]|nr:hypothetical protein [Nitrososphaerota archaeon]
MKIIHVVIIFILAIGSNASAFGQIGKPSLEQFGGIGKGWIMGLPLPLEQYRSGIKTHDIQCQPNYFILVIKAENGHPACVKPDTSKILVERGWAKPMQ